MVTELKILSADNSSKEYYPRMVRAKIICDMIENGIRKIETEDLCISIVDCDKDTVYYTVTES